MDEKVVVEAKMRDLKIAKAMLKNDIRGQVLQLGSTKIQLYLAYNEMDILKLRIIEMRAS